MCELPDFAACVSWKSKASDCATNMQDDIFGHRSSRNRRSARYAPSGGVRLRLRPNAQKSGSSGDVSCSSPSSSPRLSAHPSKPSCFSALASLFSAPSAHYPARSFSSRSRPHSPHKPNSPYYPKTNQIVKMFSSALLILAAAAPAFAAIYVSSSIAK